MNDGSHFSDVLDGNRAHAESYDSGGLAPLAAKGLAVLTCMDSRIDPLGMLGISRGDAKIMRNAGARVTEDVLRTLVLATYLLGVNRFMVVAHTNCRMIGIGEHSVHEAIQDAGGPDTRSLSFLTSDDLEVSVRTDVQRVKSFPYLSGLAVGGFRYRLEDGVLENIC
jgi:carbonic anhydrase